MSTVATDGEVTGFLDRAILGDRSGAVRRVLDLVDVGVPAASIIQDVLTPAQHEVGERWQRREWSTADEHLVTGVTHAALEALSTTLPVDTQGLVLTVCAEGDWHGLPTQLFAESLRTRGQGVVFLGASVPADDVATSIDRHRPDAVTLTCNLATAYLGASRVIDAAHGRGTPVIAGGRALTAARSRRLGADAWAPDVDAALAVLTDWRRRPPVVELQPVRLDPRALDLVLQAEPVAAAAFATLTTTYPSLADYDASQREHTHRDLVHIVEFLAAARLVDDDVVFEEFLAWLTGVLTARGVPVEALTAGLAALAPLVRDIDSGAHRLVTAATSTVS